MSVKEYKCETCDAVLDDKSVENYKKLFKEKPLKSGKEDMYCLDCLEEWAAGPHPTLELNPPKDPKEIAQFEELKKRILKRVDLLRKAVENLTIETDYEFEWSCEHLHEAFCMLDDILAENFYVEVEDEDKNNNHDVEDSK